MTETGFRTAEEMLTLMAQEIRENLQLYEPRVEVTEIEEGAEGDSGRPCLVVHCRLRASREPLSITLDPRSRAITLGTQTTPEDA